jgi:hypothetical protein
MIIKDKKEIIMRISLTLFKILKDIIKKNKKLVLFLILKSLVNE